MVETVKHGWREAPLYFNVCIACIFLSYLAWGLAFVSIYKPVPPQTTVSTAIPEQEVITYRGNYTHLSGYAFKDEDIALYKQLYTLQKDGKWETVNHQIRRLGDTVLVSDLLAQRFLSKHYRSSFNELDTWLKRYGDHPDASAIYRLAKRKKPAGATLATISTSSRSLKGSGIRDGIRGRSMPRAWREGLNAWEEEEYDSALEIFGLIASSKKKLSNWQRSGAHFWAYRASKRAGYAIKAEYHLQEAARYPFTFYGALANGQLSPEIYQPRFTKVKAPFLKRPAIKRAAALVAIGQPKRAERELRHIYRQLEPHEQHQLVTIAAALDLPALQLRTAQLKFKNPEASDITAYPTPSWIPHYDMQVDPALVYAIIRQESAFNTKAKSHAGARGPMQIMPATANYMVKQYRLDKAQAASLNFAPYVKGSFQRDHLFKPEVNLTIGQQYIQYLSEKPYIQGNIIYLLAAYNAGPGNLIKWQKRMKHVDDPLLFIERVPFTETRHYVKQVMANYLIYQTMLHGQTKSVQTLHNNGWPALRVSEQYASSFPQQYAQRQQDTRSAD